MRHLSFWTSLISQYRSPAARDGRRPAVAGDEGLVAREVVEEGLIARERWDWQVTWNGRTSPARWAGWKGRPGR